MIMAMAGRNACDILIQAMHGASNEIRSNLAREIVQLDDQQLHRVIGSLALSKDTGQRMLASANTDVEIGPTGIDVAVQPVEQ